MPQDVGSRLDARTAGPATRFGGALGRRGPAAGFFAGLVGAFVLLAGAAGLLGLLVTDVLVGPLGLGAPDGHFVRDLVADRTPALTTLSDVGTFVGGAPFLPILVALIGIGAAIKRHWRVAAFVVFVLAVESATYRVASLIVPRDRPHVHRLESLPADASYPSGHTAASVAVYCGLALLITRHLRSTGARAAVWAVAMLLPVFVAFSRMYRGMPPPLDPLSGAAIGAGAIAVLVLACRAAAAAAAKSPRRRHASTGERGLRLAATSRTKELH